jgi:hypothetical protein
MSRRRRLFHTRLTLGRRGEGNQSHRPETLGANSAEAPSGVDSSCELPKSTVSSPLRQPFAQSRQPHSSPAYTPVTKFRNRVFYFSAKMLRTNKHLRRAVAAKPSPRQVPKCKEPLPVQGAWLTTQIGFITMDEQNPPSFLHKFLHTAVGFPARNNIENAPQTQRTKTTAEARFLCCGLLHQDDGSRNKSSRLFIEGAKPWESHESVGRARPANRPRLAVCDVIGVCRW